MLVWRARRFMDVLYDYVCLRPYAKMWLHMCAWSKYAQRYSKATDFTIMSLYTMSVLFLSLLFAGSLFRYIQIVYIAICGLNILLDTWYSLFFVCCCQLCVFVLLCVFFFCFTRVFFRVCHYILCHSYYYLMLVSLDCTSCARNVYLLCIVCCQLGVLCFGHVSGFNGICCVCFLSFALYFVFYLQFKCLHVFAFVLVWL